MNHKVLLIIFIIFSSFYGYTKTPWADVNIEKLYLSPNYDKINDFLTIKQRGSELTSWIGEISDSSGRVIRSYNWMGEPKDFSWDGKSEYNRIVLDGTYSYTLFGVISSGVKKMVYYIDGIEVDGSAPQVKLKIKNRYISPNGDGVMDYPQVETIIPGRDKLKDLVITIKSLDGFTTEYSREVLDNLKDGVYRIGITGTYKNSYTSYDSQIFEINRSIPLVEIKYNYKTQFIDGNGEGKVHGDLLFSCGVEDNLEELELIIEKEGEPILFINSIDKLLKGIDFSDYNFSPGLYRVKLSSRDKFGNSYSWEKEYNTAPFLIDLPPVEFEAYSFRSEYDLTDYIKILNRYKNRRVIIETNSFNDGSSKEALKRLSYLRGEFIKSELTSGGIGEDRIDIHPLGAENSHRKSFIYIK